MSKPKTYLRLPEIPTLVTSHDLRGSKALVLLGYRDCTYETYRYMVEVENMPEDDPLVLGLQQHLEQHWLQMNIQTLLNNVLDDDNTDCNTNTDNNINADTGVSNVTDHYCSNRRDSGDEGGGGGNSVREQCVSHRRHLCHRYPLHRHHRHHPHQRNHHQRNQPCSQSRTQNSLHQHFVDALSSTELNPLNVRVTGVSNERSAADDASQRTDNESSKKHELQVELQSVISDIIVKPAQSPSSSSSETEPDRSSEGCVTGLLSSGNNNPLLATHTTTNNNSSNNNNNNDISLKDEDPERWKQLNLSIARVTQELIVLLENEGSSMSDQDEGEDGYEEEEEEEEENDDELIQDFTLNNGLEK